MLRWTASTPGGAADPIGASRSPHAATLVGGALLFIAALIPIRLMSPMFVNSQAVPVLLGTLVVAALLGFALVALEPGRAGWLVVGMLLLDVIPVIVMLSCTVAGRGQIPGHLAGDPDRHRGRLPAAAAPASCSGRSPACWAPAWCWRPACRRLGTVIESAVVIGTLTVCAVLVGRLARATATPAARSAHGIPDRRPDRPAQPARPARGLRGRGSGRHGGRRRHWACCCSTSTTSSG